MSAVQTIPEVRSFHQHGAVEFRITALIDAKRVDIHIMDAEGVIDAMEEQGHDSSIVQSLLNSCRSAASVFEDGHKLEITPLNLTGQSDVVETKIDNAKKKTAAVIELPEVARDRR
jgi:hypothetical protein